MRRASSSGLDVRDAEEGMAIATLTWPTDTHSHQSVTRPGKYIDVRCITYLNLNVHFACWEF